MSRQLLFLNLAHAYDHFFLLIFPTAVLALAPAWGMSYGEALAFGTAAFVAFGLGTLPVGWLGDRWSRTRLMTIFFVGLGGSAILIGLASGPVSLVIGLALLGLFASIYHPVGTALVVQSAGGSGRALGINGVFGNLGVAGAGLITGATAAWLGWRAAFILPGAEARTAAEVVVRMRAALAEAHLVSNTPIFTASFGIADSSMARDREGIVRLADEALYRSKQAGRDRCTIGDPQLVGATGAPSVRRERDQGAVVYIGQVARGS